MCQQINSIISLCIQISVIILIFLIRADTSKDIFNEEFAPGEKESPPRIDNGNPVKIRRNAFF